ncbi:MAG TPA: NAD-dependent epimerase/dehydratase family protein [Polyangiales bacterium]
MSANMQRLLILGCGYTGLALARAAREASLEVLGTTRSTEHVAAIEGAGARALRLQGEGTEQLARELDARTALVVTFPPDGSSDARWAPLARHSYAAAYVSSSGVFGDQHGVIDDHTHPAPDSPRTEQRLAAEHAWRAAGATVLRAAAIYGPGRGQHERVRSGSARIVGDGSHHICRIHVEDLARALLAAVRLRLGPEAYLVADDLPAPQGEVVRFLAARLGVPVPPSVPLELAPETLRHDRQLDASRFKRAARISWRYPTYREGFDACLRAEAEG